MAAGHVSAPTVRKPSPILAASTTASPATAAWQTICTASRYTRGLRKIPHFWILHELLVSDVSRLCQTGHATVVSFRASGSVDDYEDDVRRSILLVLAAAAGLGKEHGGVLTVVAASVLLEATFPVDGEQDAVDAAAALTEQLPSAAAMTAAFADEGPSIEAESAPQTAVVVGNH